jgi:LuxR family maltose regulon positive regulatory protein
MAGWVLSELADAGSSVTLVIDDLHELTSPEALTQLIRLLTNLPPHVHVSPNTVNAHIRSIYAKLQVRDRSSAVRRARELRLLATAGRPR